MVMGFGGIEGRKRLVEGSVLSWSLFTFHFIH